MPIVIFVWILFSPLLLEANSLPGNSSALSISIELAKADELYKKRRIQTNAWAALASYRALLDGPEHTAAAWRFAMASQYLAARLQDSPEKAKYLLSQAIERTEAALEQKPDCPHIKFWLAVSLAIHGSKEGPFTFMRRWPRIRKQLEAVALQEPSLALGGPERVLGTILMKLPRAVGGDPWQARKLLESSLKHAPNEPLTILALYELEGEHFHNQANAVALLEKARHIPFPAHEFAESQEAWEKLQQQRKQLLAANDRAP